MTSFRKTLADANRTPPHSPAVPFPVLMPFLMIFPIYLFVCEHMQAHLRVHGEVRDQIQILRLGVQCKNPLSILSKPFYDLELNLIQPKPSSCISVLLSPSIHSVSDLVLEITLDKGSEIVKL